MQVYCKWLSEPPDHLMMQGSNEPQMSSVLDSCWIHTTLVLRKPSMSTWIYWCLQMFSLRKHHLYNSHSPTAQILQAAGFFRKYSVPAVQEAAVLGIEFQSAVWTSLTFNQLGIHNNGFALIFTATSLDWLHHL